MARQAMPIPSIAMYRGLSFGHSGMELKKKKSKGTIAVRTMLKFPEVSYQFEEIHEYAASRQLARIRDNEATLPLTHEVEKLLKSAVKPFST